MDPFAFTTDKESDEENSFAEEARRQTELYKQQTLIRIMQKPQSSDDESLNGDEIKDTDLSSENESTSDARKRKGNAREKERDPPPKKPKRVGSKSTGKCDSGIALLHGKISPKKEGKNVFPPLGATAGPSNDLIDVNWDEIEESFVEENTSAQNTLGPVRFERNGQNNEKSSNAGTARN
ncbi:hypothetical protein QAD02_000706 [Eretmocerus hayati]|uniref:Uncharacterized protein n=1 Tax=Eretmocerus hayati TaxID=131215 RepID=A0ACC2NGU9_9HYME|nr:hypothetical protein QAD02_000706 [Eretmocerus hayati]